MRRRNGYTRWLLISIAAFICMAMVLWSSSVSQAAFFNLHDFKPEASQGDGGYPQGSFALSGSTLFGMTAFGGSSHHGTIFQINTDGSGYRVLHNFNGGTTDGAYPYGSLILSGSTLYGMTSGGGANGGYGAIFRMNTDGSGYQVLYSFSGGSTDGAAPYGSLTLSGSTLYGMTSRGGANGGYGTIFQVNTDGSGYRILHDFHTGNTSDGEGPCGDLTLSGSTLYGMTNYGGANDNGNIFKIETDGTGFQVLYDFSGSNDGAYPYGSLAVSGSTLYGMMQYGGANGGYGTIFQINKDGSGFHVVHSFSGSATDGSTPYGSLTLSGSTLYGTTSEGGSGNSGIVFSLTDSATKSLLWSGEGGSASIWTLDSSNGGITYVNHGPYGGWTPVSYTVNPDGTRTLLWSGEGGSASLWTLDSSNKGISNITHGPCSGWMPIQCR